MILGFVGAKTQRQLETPVSYHIKQAKLHCFTAKDNLWWKNIRTNGQVHLYLKGKNYTGYARVVETDYALMSAALTDFLISTPRDAGPSGVHMEAGRPDPDDVNAAIKKLVYITIEPTSDDFITRL
ncbi:MAG: hypothetical protein KUG79_00280 [Pseudomonadales bacterium]|nr:hypothetical protein [Pseudomonadales bacterium]